MAYIKPLIYFKKLIMEHRPVFQSGFTFYFDADDLRELLEKKPDYVLVTANIEEVETREGKAGALVVKAEAYSRGLERLARKPGCPVPPCIPR